MKKLCIYCSKEFYKRINYSKKYWETAKYCSSRCGRMMNNPAKMKPNNFTVDGDVVKIEIKSKRGLFYGLVDKDDYFSNSEISQSRWSLSSSGYMESCLTTPEGKHLKKYLHHFVLPRKEGFVVDHKNINTLDNRKENLRYLTHRNNVRNQKVRGNLGITGSVMRKDGKIRLRFKDNGKEFTLGVYDSHEEAVLARINAEKKYWGISFFEEKLGI